MTIFYLAASYGRKYELVGYRTELQHFGYECTSSWLDVSEEVTDFAIDDHAAEYAAKDLNDISKSTAVVLFSENGNPSRGGRHVEFGFAYAHFKPIIVIGEKENIFQSLPRVLVIPTWAEFVRCLTAGDLDERISGMMSKLSHF